MRFTFILCMLIASTLSSPSVLAHAALTESSPYEGSVLPAPPKRLVLKFNEPVSPLLLRVLGPDGLVYDLAGAVWDDDGLIVPLTYELKRGTHLLSWRVISQDGHPVGGSLSFSVGETGGRVAPAVDAATGFAPLIWTARVALYACVFVGIGGMFFIAWFMGANPLPRSVTILVEGALLAIVPVAVTSLALLGIDAIAGTWSAIANLSAWRAALSSTYSLTAVLSIIASVLALTSARRERTASRVLSALAVLTAAAALTASGHATTAPPQWISRPAIVIHTSSLIFWIGALLPMAGAFALARPGRVKTLMLFSETIPWVVGALVLTGVALAILQLRSWEALISSSYGQVLLLKLLLVALLFVMAAYNRLNLTSRMKVDEARAELGFVRSIRIELVLVLAILGTVALWRFTPPPRALANSHSIISLHLHEARLMANVSISPGQVGANSVTVLLLGQDQRPLVAKELQLDTANEQAGIEPVRRQAISKGEGSWRVTDLMLPTPGRWTLSLNVLVDDFTSVRLEERFTLQP